MKKLKWVELCFLLVFCASIMYVILSCAHKDDDSTNVTSPVASEEEKKNPTPTPTPTNLLLSDPLTNGTSIATQIGGGEFTSEGYDLSSQFGYIIYDTDITGNFRVEFDTKGLTPGEYYHAPDDQSTILFMQDAPLGTDWTQWKSISHCLFQLIKLDYYPGSSSTDQMKVKAGCDGGASGFEFWSYLGGHGGSWVGPEPTWDASQTYHWKVTVVDGHVEGFRDDVQLFTGDGFWPGDPMRFFFGGTGAAIGQLSPDNAIYANIKIYRE
jgi:hypothetical protein